MGLRWVLAVFDLRFGVEFGHFGSVLRDGMIAVVGFAGGVLWLAGGLLPCAELVRALWAGCLLMRAVAWWDGRCLP